MSRVRPGFRANVQYVAASLPRMAGKCEMAPTFAGAMPTAKRPCTHVPMITMSLPDTGLLGTRTMTIAELGEIRAGLSAGRPRVLGLVFNHHLANKEASGPAGVPWENHQVMAYDVVASPGSPGAVSIRIYDPNYPKQDDVVIRCRPRIGGMMMVGPWGGVEAPLMGAECERVVGTRRGMAVRGVFVMPYSGAVVPEKLE